MIELADSSENSGVNYFLLHIQPAQTLGLSQSHPLTHVKVIASLETMSLIIFNTNNKKYPSILADNRIMDE